MDCSFQMQKYHSWCDHLIVQAWWGHRSHHPSVLPETNAGNRALTVDKIFGTLGWYTTVIRCLPAEEFMTHFSYALRITHRCAIYVQVPVRVNSRQQRRKIECVPRQHKLGAQTPPLFQPLPEARHLDLFYLLIYLLTFLLAFDNMADLWRVSILCTANLPASLMSMTPNLEI